MYTGKRYTGESTQMANLRLRELITHLSALPGQEYLPTRAQDGNHANHRPSSQQICSPGVAESLFSEQQRLHSAVKPPVPPPSPCSSSDSESGPFFLGTSAMRSSAATQTAVNRSVQPAANTSITAAILLQRTS